MYDNLFSIFSYIEVVRNKCSILEKERVAKGQWSVLIFLAIIIFSCLLYLNTNLVFFQFLIIILGTVLVLTLLTIRDLQNLRLGGKIMPVLESGQEVLESIGKLRYYNKELIEKGLNEVPKHVKKYRLGLHKPGEKAKIKIIKK